ncbi:MAG: zinc metalloprotease HtpX [Ignavibacteriae bacterium]|nr:MAG: zinc metalloprotease HtpX [Ignavibacteriota bacterium]
MNTFKTIILMTLLMMLFLIAGFLLGGKTGLIIAFIFSIGMNFFSYWFSDKVILKLYKARQVNHDEYPDLYRIVQNLSMRANLPMPKVYIIDDDTPNAFATGRNPSHAAVAVTTGIMSILTWNELEGVIGHELTHIRNHDILIGTIAAAVVGTITFAAEMASWSTFFLGGRSDDDDEGSNIVSTLLLIIFAPIAAILLQMAISRAREYMADTGGAKLSGQPLYLASALKKLHMINEKTQLNHAGPATSHLFIVNPLKGKGLFGLFSTHPPVEERIKRLNDMALDII